MQVILMEQVGKLGTLGDKVSVKGGYARNFLLPKGKAVIATKANLALVDSKKAEVRELEQKSLDQAKLRSTQISEIKVNILARAGEGGRLFGSVGSRDIISGANKLGINIDNSEIRLKDGPLRELGEHKVVIFLHPEVETTLMVEISPEI